MSKSITPARFYELLDKSDNDTIRLWNAYINAYYCYNYIEKCLYTDVHWEWRVMVNDECDVTHILSDLYESKPKTLYDEVISGGYITSPGIKYFAKKYKSQLESITIEED